MIGLRVLILMMLLGSNALALASTVTVSPIIVASEQGAGESLSDNNHYQHLLGDIEKSVESSTLSTFLRSFPNPIFLEPTNGKSSLGLDCAILGSYLIYASRIELRLDSHRIGFPFHLFP
ncbi:hypothetical protein [Nonlabens agnitus]|nr:hypothetical protein [Nonlabens agnitus]